jgi:hypothetical protein
MSEVALILDSMIFFLFLMMFPAIYYLIMQLRLVNRGVGGAIGGLGEEIFEIRSHLDSLSELVPNVNLIQQSNPLGDLAKAYFDHLKKGSSDAPYVGRDAAGQFAAVDDSDGKEKE